MRSRAAEDRNPAARCWFDYFNTQLGLVLESLGLHPQRDVILTAFEIIGAESFGSFSTEPPRFSRINLDGLPLQYALALGAFEPTLQFVSEARVPRSSNLAHIKLSKEKIETLCRLLLMDEGTFALTKLLDEMVPETDPDLLSDHAGALWISPSFTRHKSPKLTLYMNAKWGSAKKQKDRLERFASYFCAEAHWEKFAALAEDEMQPLGVAVNLSKESQATGRIYLSTFGKRVDYFADLARALNNRSLDVLIERYATITLAAASMYPTQSAVCSIGIGMTRDPELKIELCGHCAFANDVDAKARCLEWLAYMNIDSQPYLQLLEILSEGCLNPTSSVLHAYVGIGIKEGQPYSTIYLKPTPVHTA